jgi:prevent-host-death family protein
MKAYVEALMTATELRRNIYQVLDEVLETGQPVEVVRNGRQLLIVPAGPARQLAGIPKRNLVNGSFDDLVNTSWEGSWEIPE